MALRLPVAGLGGAFLALAGLRSGGQPGGWLAAAGRFAGGSGRRGPALDVATVPRTVPVSSHRGGQRVGWVRLLLAYVVPSLPPSFAVTAVVALCYAAAWLVSAAPAQPGCD